MALPGAVRRPPALMLLDPPQRGGGGGGGETGQSEEARCRPFEAIGRDRADRTGAVKEDGVALALDRGGVGGDEGQALDAAAQFLLHLARRRRLRFFERTDAAAGQDEEIGA